MNWTPAATDAGLDRSALDPSPSWPKRFAPQQYASPLWATPHVCSAPALTPAKGSPPDTRTGLSRSTLVPSPRLPTLFCPQQNAALSVVTAHVWLPWTAVLSALKARKTANGALVAPASDGTAPASVYPLPCRSRRRSPQVASPFTAC